MINSHYLLGLPILQITEVLRVPQLSFRIHRIKPAHFCGELTHLTRRYRRAGCGRTLEGNPPPSQRAAAGTSSGRRDEQRPQHSRSGLCPASFPAPYSSSTQAGLKTAVAREGVRCVLVLGAPRRSPAAARSGGFPAAGRRRDPGPCALPRGGGHRTGPVLAGRAGNEPSREEAGRGGGGVGGTTTASGARRRRARRPGAEAAWPRPGPASAARR